MHARLYGMELVGLWACQDSPVGFAKRPPFEHASCPARRRSTPVKMTSHLPPSATRPRAVRGSLGFTGPHADEPVRPPLCVLSRPASQARPSRYNRGLEDMERHATRARAEPVPPPKSEPATTQRRLSPGERIPPATAPSGVARYSRYAVYVAWCTLHGVVVSQAS